MRGKLDGIQPEWVGERNILAYAGKTQDLKLPILGVEEHPRVCGENGVMIRPVVSRKGTSPRMRGKHRAL